MIPQISAQISRLIHNGQFMRCANKSLLAKLRKKTGYTFTNCRKALELHENNVEKAETWLKEQAQQHGWTEAAKLHGRNTSQGLITVAVNKCHAVMSEINCETDFVAQNKKFKDFAKTVTNALLNHAKSQESGNGIQRILFHTDSLKVLPAADGKLLNDHTALTIGSLGENIILRRALLMNVQMPDVMLYGYAHPMKPASMAFGKYGAIVAVKWQDDDYVLGTQLCQHVIGMNPERIGNSRVDEPRDNVEEESCMIYQEFLFDPDLSVQQILENAKAEIIDFARFEIGERSKSAEVCN